LTGFRSKTGRPFAAALKISPEFKLEFDFGNAVAEGDSVEIDFSGLAAVGSCPKCGANVYEQPMAYVCEKSVGAARSCDFRSGRVILQQPIEPEQMRKLLHDGRTDLLRGFVSNRTRRKFAAYLVRKPDGTTGFEFEARGERAAQAKPAPAHAAKAAARTASTSPAAPARTKPPAKTAKVLPAGKAASAGASSEPASSRRKTNRPAAPPASSKAAAARKTAATKSVARTIGRAMSRRTAAK
jgi:DNA topoisomerase-3